MGANFATMKRALLEIERLWADRFHPAVSDQIEQMHMVLREEVTRGLHPERSMQTDPWPWPADEGPWRSVHKLGPICHRTIQCTMLRGHEGDCEPHAQIIPNAAPAKLLHAYVDGKEVGFTELGNGMIRLDAPIEDGDESPLFRLNRALFASRTRWRLRLRRWLDRGAALARLRRHAEPPKPRPLVFGRMPNVNRIAIAREDSFVDQPGGAVQYDRPAEEVLRTRD